MGNYLPAFLTRNNNNNNKVEEEEEQKKPRPLRVTKRSGGLNDLEPSLQFPEENNN